MNILFIWTGVTKPLYEWRIRCIRQAMKIYPEAKFQVITTLKEFFGMQIIDANEILDKLNDEFSIGINLTDPICFSDYARYYWLARNPKTLYIDTDAFCTLPIPETMEIGHDDYWAIWNGTDLNGISNILAQHAGKRILLHTPKLLAMVGRNLAQYFIHKPVWRNY
jgi:hypothetical protein